MPITNCQLPIEKQPFAKGEKRVLTVSVVGSREPVAGEIVVGSREPVVGEKQKPTTDYALPTTIRVEAEHRRAEKHPTHETRYYEIAISGQRSAVRVQLNGDSPADDAFRLAAIAEDLLSKPEELMAER